MHNAAGRALRRQAGAVRLGDVVHCMGDFASGDAVVVGFRGADGGQFAIAAAVAACAAARIDAWLGGARDGDAAEVVVRAEDLRLLWPVRP